MSEVLNDKCLFDSEFYSCFLGAAKPKLAFFEKTVAVLGCEPGNVLFIDDRAENVEAAQRAGLNARVYFGTDGAASLQHRLAEFGVCVGRPLSKTDTTSRDITAGDLTP